MHALILQDIKSRFFGNGIGYVISIFWPATHIAVLLIIFAAMKRPVPYGNSALLYASTGVAPYICWSYISRFMCLGVIMNKNFLAYPIIKPLDMMFARLFLEIISTYIITVGLLFALVVCQVQAMPFRPWDAAAGLLSAVLLGAGFGVFNAVICMIVQLWQVVYVLVLVIAWITCGLAINPEAMPDKIGRLLAYNPLLHSIEWIRSAYYLDYPAHFLDKSYVLWCGTISLVLGLIMERVLRRFML